MLTNMTYMRIVSSITNEKIWYVHFIIVFMHYLYKIIYNTIIENQNDFDAWGG